MVKLSPDLHLSLIPRLSKAIAKCAWAANQLFSDFTGTRILFVILRVVDVVRMVAVMVTDCGIAMTLSWPCCMFQLTHWLYFWMWFAHKLWLPACVRHWLMLYQRYMYVDAPTLRMIIEEQRQAIQAVLKKLAYSLPVDLSSKLYFIAGQLVFDSMMRLHSLHTWRQQVRSSFHACGCTWRIIITTK